MLERIRSKPEHVKKSLALVLTIFFFTIIMSVWLSSWDARATSEASKQKADGPLASLKSVLSGITDEIKTTYSSEPTFSGQSVASTTSGQGASVFDASRVVVIDRSKDDATTTSTTTATTTNVAE